MYDINPEELDFTTACCIARVAARNSGQSWLVIADTDGSFYATPADDDPDSGVVVHVARPA